VKILAVDDDPIILDLIDTTLAKAGSCDVTTASSGAEALKLLSTTPAAFDCLLLDVEMPVMDGIDLCKEIRALPKYLYTPILMLTQRTDARAVGRAFVAGATDYITKPFEVNDLLGRLRVAKRMMETTDNAPRISAQDMKKRGIPGAHRFKENEPFYIVGIPQLVLPFSLGAYLSQQSRNHLDQCYIFAATINNFEQLYQRGSTRELCLALTATTKALARGINRPDLLMSHNGGGTLLCVFTSEQKSDWRAVESAVRKELWNRGPRYDTGTKIKISLSLARPIQPNASPTQRVKKTFDRAIQRVERHRPEGRALKADLPQSRHRLRAHA
jgi:DNA-binding response OmpR family regulator